MQVSLHHGDIMKADSAERLQLFVSPRECVHCSFLLFTSLYTA